MFFYSCRQSRGGEAFARHNLRSTFDQNKMSDTMLMPPPPPRLPKRQKTASSLGDAAEATAAADEPTHPDLILIPPPPQRRSAAAGGGDDNEYFENSLSSGESTRSVSPKDFDNNGEKSINVSPAAREDSSGIRVATNEFGTEEVSGGTAKSTAATRSHVEPSFNRTANDDKANQSRDDRFGVNNENNQAMGGEDVFHDARLGNIPPQNNYELSTPHDSNEISATESSRSGQHGSKKNKQSRGRDSPPSINVSFRDIIGHGQAKLRLDEALLPLALPPDLVDSVLTGIRAAPASILLHGPPGCGKTKLAKAVAGEAQAAFISIGPSDILSKFVGESEASIRGLFKEARRKARKMESKCAVVFFDEIDALGRSRVDEESGKMSQAGGDNSSRRVLAELLIQMTGLDDDNGEEESESEAEDEECDDDCDDGDSFAGRSTMSTGTGSFNRNDMGSRQMSPMSSSNHFEMKVQANEQEVGTPTRPGETNNHFNADKMQMPKPRVIVVAATNRPEDCDPALLRRFAVRVLVGLPSRKDRKKIIRRLLSNVEHDITSSQLDELALATEGWSGSDLESMTREAVMAPVRECLRVAAILKRRESKVVQRSGADSSQTHEQKRAEDAHNAARESLLNSFRNLRPVSSKDFEDGIAFFLGDQQQDNSAHAHYDSSSSSEDEE
mmetsp:Transcript_1249/g.2445  ORF Transcript_1249/g.2445 Transcript_1249/m.2445 type:complete len:672 (+) Transcript_1249:3-2018(+)